jgi:hypothetical protein
MLSLTQIHAKFHTNIKLSHKFLLTFTQIHADAVYYVSLPAYCAEEMLILMILLVMLLLLMIIVKMEG